AVSFKLSPFCRLEVAAEMFTTSALSRNAANSKEVRVRVLGSTKKLIRVFPRSAGTFFMSREPTVLKAPAVSRIVSISQGSSSRIPRRSLRCQLVDADKSGLLPFTAFPTTPNQVQNRFLEGGL